MENSKGRKKTFSNQSLLSMTRNEADEEVRKPSMTRSTCLLEVFEVAIVRDCNKRRWIDLHSLLVSRVVSSLHP